MVILNKCVLFYLVSEKAFFFFSFSYTGKHLKSFNLHFQNYDFITLRPREELCSRD